MKKKNKTKTFAQRAQDIIKSFPRAKYDSIEKSALEGAMEKLMIEQEAFRQANNMGQGQQEIQSLAYGGYDEDPLVLSKIRPSYSDQLGRNLWGLKNMSTPAQLTPLVSPYTSSSPYPLPYYGNNITGGDTAMNAPRSYREQNYMYGPESTSPIVDFGTTPATKKAITTPSSITGSTMPVGTSSTGTVKSANTATAATVASAASPAPSPADIVKQNSINSLMGPPTMDQMFANSYTRPQGLREWNMMPKMKTGLEKMSEESPKVTTGLEMDKINAKIADNKAKVAGKGDGTSLLPSYISAGTSLLGNIAQMIFDKRPKPLNLPKYTPEGIDLYNQRLGLRRDADVDRSTMLNQTRNVGMNAGQTISAMNSGTAGLQRNLGRALTESELAEQQYNVGARNRAGEVNAMTGMREGMMNKQMEEMWKQRQSEYLAGATNTIPEFMSDVNRIKYQDKYLKQLSDKDRAMLELLMNSSQNYGGYFTPDGRFVSDIYYKGPKR